MVHLYPMTASYRAPKATRAIAAYSTRGNTGTGKPGHTLTSSKARRAEWEAQDGKGTIPLTALRSELRQWREFFAPYHLGLVTVAVRAVRLYIDTVRRYPHTPIVRELTAPRHNSKWDNPLKPLDEDEY